MKKGIRKVVFVLVLAVSLVCPDYRRVSQASEPFAEVDNVMDLKQNLEAGKSVKLTGDIVFSTDISIEITGNVTLDLNGYCIDIETGRGGYLPFTINRGSFTIDDSKGNPSPSLISYTIGTVSKTEMPKTVNEYYTGGSIQNCESTLFSVMDGTLHIKKGCFAENGKAEDGIDGGVIKSVRSDIILDTAVFVRNSGSWGGAMHIVDGNVKIGNGTVLSENTALNRGGAIYAAGSAKIVMNGGYITNNKTQDALASEGGGGFYLHEDTEFTMNSGYITQNLSAWGGGGVQVGYHDTNDSAEIHIKGGYISGNIAEKGEGGGINVGTNCSGTITEGYITYNKMGTKKSDDWGGGGIFIGDHANMQITHVLIEDNHADGFGGGLAGCSTGYIFTFLFDGSGIFDNTASSQNLSGGGSTKNSDHYINEKEIFKDAGSEGHQDYFCANSSEIVNGMLGGGLEKWQGSGDDKLVSAVEKDDLLTAASYMGLTSHATEADKAKARSAAKVIITGNQAYTHGGGVLCNGYLTLGNATKVAISLPVKKTDVNGNGLSGAELKIIEKGTNTEVASWISKAGESYDFGENLDYGKTYILRETLAPAGYAYASDIEFSVDENGIITMPESIKTEETAGGDTVYQIEDKEINMLVEKTDTSSGKRLSGAEFTVKEKESGTLVDSWTSGDTVYKLGEKLSAGSHYLLTETKAPEGYEKINQEIEFAISKQGEISLLTDMAEAALSNGILTVKNTEVSEVLPTPTPVPRQIAEPTPMPTPTPTPTETNHTETDLTDKSSDDTVSSTDTEDEDDTEDDGDEESDVDDESGDGTEDSDNAVSTGDDFNLVIMFTIFSLSGVLLPVLVKIRKRA